MIKRSLSHILTYCFIGSLLLFSTIYIVSCGNVLGLAFLPSSDGADNGNGTENPNGEPVHWQFTRSLDNIYAIGEMPRNLTIDENGNLFIDFENNTTVRRHDPDGTEIGNFALFEYNANHRPVVSNTLEHSTLYICDNAEERIYSYSAGDGFNESFDDLIGFQFADEPLTYEAYKAYPLSGNHYLIWYKVHDGPGYHRLSLVDISDDTLSATYDANGIIRDVTKGPEHKFYLLVDRGDFITDFEVDVLRVDLSASELVIEKTVELSVENTEEPPLGSPYRFGVDEAGNFHVLDKPPFDADIPLSVKSFDSAGRFLSNWATEIWDGQGQFIYISENYQSIAVHNNEAYVIDRREGGNIQVFSRVSQWPSGDNSSVERAFDETRTAPGLNDEWYLTVTVRDAANNPITGLMRDAFEVQPLSGEGTTSIAFVYDDSDQPGDYRMALIHDHDATENISFAIEVMEVEVGSFTGLTVEPVNTADRRRIIKGFFMEEIIISTAEGVSIGEIIILLPTESTLVEDDQYKLEYDAIEDHWKLTVYTDDIFETVDPSDDNMSRQTLRIHFDDADEGDRQYIDIWFIEQL